MRVQLLHDIQFMSMKYSYLWVYDQVIYIRKKVKFHILTTSSASMKSLKFLIATISHLGECWCLERPYTETRKAIHIPTNSRGSFWQQKSSTPKCLEKKDAGYMWSFPALASFTHVQEQNSVYFPKHNFFSPNSTSTRESTFSSISSPCTLRKQVAKPLRLEAKTAKHKISSKIHTFPWN